ncbi:MAG: CRISPR-associated protein Csx19 [Chloroflexota bacterium]|nr:CRISPR-associated protein Csx19 [Chloroflexota bacterium]
MSRERRAVDFKALIEQMDREQISAGQWPTVVGGKCAEGEMVDWLKDLDLSGMPIRIWSFTDHCTINDDGPPQTVKHLERARIFGAGGDLDMRRDGDRFHWRYVGKAEYAPKYEGKQNLEWPGTDVSPIYCREREALLWGTRKKEQGQWFEDRVAGADLTYFAKTPALLDQVEERVKVKFWEYTQAGRTLAIWLLGLVRYEEEKND